MGPGFSRCKKHAASVQKAAASAASDDDPVATTDWIRLQRVANSAINGCHMRRFLTRMLIVSVLFAGLAWAADSHAEAFFGHDSELSAAHGAGDGTALAERACDHCCHGAAHLTGLPGNLVMATHQVGGSYVPPAQPSIDSVVDIPPTPPPNA